MRNDAMKGMAAMVAALLAILPVARAAAEAPTATVSAVRAAVECTARGGLPNFFAKAAQGGNFTVAYLGGSITAQPGWRVKSLAWLSARYPQSKFTEVNAAIGGTGSDLGVLRIEHDVLVAKPDLLFVEFAVNDAGATPPEIIKSMEGIVRKTWRKFPGCDICFVYTFSEPLLAELKAGRFNRSAATMEVVADHYGVPTVHLGLEAVRLEGEGKLLMKAPQGKVERVAGEELNVASKVAMGADGKIPFSADGVHPYIDSGHQLYLDALVRSVPAMLKASGGASPHALPAPLDPENYERTVMVPLDELERRGPWTRLPAESGLGKTFAARVDSLWKAEVGAELTFTFKGSAAKIYDLIGPDCGFIEITVDGKVSRLRKIDGYSVSARLGMSTVAGGLDPTKVHTVRVKVLGDAVPKPEILFEKNRDDLAKHPEKYAGTNWYAGAVFIVGERGP